MVIRHVLLTMIQTLARDEARPNTHLRIPSYPQLARCVHEAEGNIRSLPRKTHPTYRTSNAWAYSSRPFAMIYDPLRRQGSAIKLAARGLWQVVAEDDLFGRLGCGQDRPTVT